MAISISAKRHLHSVVAQKAGVSKVEAQQILDALGEVVVDVLKSGGDITLPGGIKVETKVRNAIARRETVHPQTGERIVHERTPAKRTVKARPLQSLKNKVDTIVE